MQIDGAALLFAAGASVLTAVLFGLVPAFRAAGINLNSHAARDRLARRRRRCGCAAC